MWLVAAAETPDYKHVVGCIDTSTCKDLDADLNDKVYELASIISRQHDARCSTVHAWHFEDKSLLDGRIPRGQFERFHQERRDYIEGLIDTFLHSHGSEATDPYVHILKGDPAHVITSFSEENNVDLIVMGTVARSGLPGMVMGNTAERILNSINYSVLAVKPDSFVSPFTAGEYIDYSKER